MEGRQRVRPGAPRGRTDGIGGIVLCGGASRRMGTPKAWLEIAGRPMLTVVIERLAAAVDTVVVVAAVGQELPPLPPHVSRTEDAVSGRGPLEGFVAGWRSMPARVELAMVVAGDMPRFPTGVVELLMRLPTEAEVAVPRIGDRLQPLCALYRRSTAALAAELLAQDRRSMHDLLSACRSPWFVDESQLRTVDPRLAGFGNINTPEDLTALLDDEQGTRAGE